MNKIFPKEYVLEPLGGQIYCRRTGTSRICLLKTVASGALCVGILSQLDQAYADPDLCTINGSVATCSGDQSEGIASGTDFTSPPIDTLYVNNLDATGITPDPNVDGINFLSAEPQGITIHVDTAGTAGIVTTGTSTYGIKADSTGIGSIAIQNNGYVKSDYSAIEARVLGAGGNVTITNSGNIKSIERAGIWGDVTTLGDVAISNSGTIEASGAGIIGSSAFGNVTITNYADITGFIIAGIEAAASGDISITSSGTIEHHEANEGILVEGFNAAGKVKITNNSDIVVFNNGIDVGGKGDVGIINTGDIEVKLGKGINAGGHGDITISNSGNISGVGFDFGEFPDGIEVITEGATGQITITNTGTISSNRSYGIFAGHSDTGTVEIYNSGLISGAVGISLRESTGPGATASIINSGNITGSGGFAISFLGDGHDSLTLLAGSEIEGAIDFGRGNDGSGGSNADDLDTLTIGRGVNAELSFADHSGTDNDIESAPETINFASAGTSINGGAGVIAVDTTGFAASGTIISDLVSSVFNSIEHNIQNPQALSLDFLSSYSTHSMEPLPALSAQGPRLWGSFFGSASKVAGSTSTVEFNHGSTGVVTGIETSDIGHHNVFGVLSGYSRSKVSLAQNAGETTTASLFGGIYWKRNFEYLHIHTAFIAGLTDYEMSRNLGTSSAVGKSDGWFYSPSITVSAPVNFAFKPATLSARISYAGFHIDEYTETGVLNPLSVEERDVSLFNFRTQFKLPTIWDHTNGSRTNLDISVGVDATIDAGSDEVHAVVAGTPLSFAADTTEDVSGFFGVGVLHTSLDARTSAGFSGEIQSGLDGSLQTSGEFKASFKF